MADNKYPMTIMLVHNGMTNPGLSQFPKVRYERIEVEAPTPHLARRRILNRMLWKGHQVKKIEIDHCEV